LSYPQKYHLVPSAPAVGRSKTAPAVLFISLFIQNFYFFRMNK
jgi:hypothetical protein